MSKKSSFTHYKQEIINHLIDKYEASESHLQGKNGRRPQFNFNRSIFTEPYEKDYQAREGINAALSELAQEGLVLVEWEKFRVNDQATRVILIPDEVFRAYRQINRVPITDQQKKTLTLLSKLENHPWEWVKNWAFERKKGLTKAKKRRIHPTELIRNEQLIHVLEELPEITKEQSVPRRIISQKLLGESKKFENEIQPLLLSALRKYGPCEFERDIDYLDYLGITINPQQVLIAGGGRYRINEKEIDLYVLPGEIGLSHETVAAITIEQLPEQIVTIENLTSFHQFIKTAGNEKILTIYTGGFPNKTVQAFISKIASYLQKQQNTTNCRHWGDMDYGGINIFSFIKENFIASLIPLWMDVKTFMEYKDQGIESNEADIRKLTTSFYSSKYSEWTPLLQEMIKHRRQIEQETILPTPIDRI